MDLSDIEPEMAGHSIDEAGLARAVRTDHAERLAGVLHDVDVIERADAAEILHEPAGKEQLRHLETLLGKSDLSRAP